MDITKVNGIINQNSGFTGRQLNIVDISRFNYKSTRCTKVYDDKFISKFDINIQTYLKDQNKEYEKKDVILKTPHPVPYDSILE